MLYTGRTKVSQLESTSYFDLQQQQPDDDDDEESALCIKRKPYGATTTTSSSPSPPSAPPPPAIETTGRRSRSARRDPYIWDDFVLPALDPKAHEVASATPHHQTDPSWFMRRKPPQVNLSTIRANYRISRKRARDDNPKVYGFIDDVKHYLHYNVYSSMIKSILLANRTIVLFVNLDLFADLLLCSAYLIEMKQGYNVSLSPHWLFKQRSHDLWVFCQILSLWNICSFAIRFLITRYPLSVLLSFRGLGELITSIPLLASRFLPYGQYLYVPYFLRSWVCLLRIKSALKIKVTLRMTDKPVDAIQYKQIYLVGMIVVLLYNGMAAFQYSEAIFGGNNYCVLDSLYVVVVTLSTVGYGDITPSAPMSRIVMMLLILITVAVIPSLVSDFLETMQKRDATGSQVIKGAEPFILIVGSFTAEQAKDTLDGFLNMDNIDGKLSVIFLDTKPLTDDLKLLGRNSVWGHRIQFLHSPCLNEKAMQRANARYAKAIFTISDLNALDPMKEDEHNTVRLWSLYCYTARYDVPIYSYNLSPSTAIYQKVAKEVICVRQFNQYLLALNCRCRGASTLLTNLLHQREPLNQYDHPWEAQYDDGSCNEIYTAPAAACIVGISFCRAAWVLYNEHQVILFAVKTYIPEKDGYEIILNPFRNTHIIKDSDLCFYIAQSSKEIRDIETLSSLYVWQMVRIQEYSVDYPDDDYGSTHQRHCLTPTLPPSPSSSSLPSSPPTKRRYQITRLPSSSHSLLIGISGGGAALNMSKLSSGRQFSTTDYDENEDDDDMCNDDDDDMSIAQSEASSLKCYLLEEPAEWDDVIIQSAAGMRNHVIVCMHEEFINLFKFIYNLRSPHLRPEELQDIVLLCTEQPSPKAFDTISSFPRVYFMEGNCRQPDDLLRAGVKRAKQVVVMSEKENPEQQGASADSAAIMTSHIIHLLLHRHKRNPYIIVNLVERSNIKFMHLLQGKQVDEEVDVFYTPAYAAGDVVADSLISNVLLSQTYYKPDIVQVIKALSGMPPTTSAEANVRREKVESNWPSNTDQPSSSRLTSIPVPDLFIGQTFSRLFESLLLDQGVLALGLLRAPDKVTFGNELPFVYSNPVPSLILRASDFVYILAQPGWVL